MSGKDIDDADPRAANQRATIQKLQATAASFSPTVLTVPHKESTAAGSPIAERLYKDTATGTLEFSRKSPSIHGIRWLQVGT